MSLARRYVLQDRVRLAISVAGVALAVALILLLNGFLSGMYRQIAAYLDHAPGTVVVAQDGIRNLLGATSLLPPAAVEDAHREAATIVPILSQFIILDLHGKKQPIYLIGYDSRHGGGPWRISQGREPESDDEVIVDRVLADRHDLARGDEIAMLDRRFTIVGLSDGTTSWMTSFIFVRKTAAESLLRVPGATSFLLVTPAGDLPAEALRDRLDRLPGADAVLKREMIASDARLFGRVFSAPIKLMVGIAFLVGTLVVGLVIYTATIERQREYGVLKAIGARNRLLYRTVAAQALIVASLGAILGVGLAYAGAALIMTLRPQFLVIMESSTIVWALLAGLGMALLAALLPARTVALLAPAEVLRR